MGAKIRFNIKVTERTEIHATPEELSASARVITTVGEPKLIGGQTMRDAIIQQIGNRKYLKRLNKLGLKVEI